MDSHAATTVSGDAMTGSEHVFSSDVLTKVFSRFVSEFGISRRDEILFSRFGPKGSHQVYSSGVRCYSARRRRNVDREISTRYADVIVTGIRAI